MFEALERMELAELETRWGRARAALLRLAPQAGGLLVFSNPARYHLSGTVAGGVLWLPLEGRPVQLCRRALTRARLESPMDNVPFRSFGDLDAVLREAGSPLTDAVAVEMSGLSWALGQLLSAKLPGVRMLAGDAVVSMAQAVKTPWELAKMRLAGERHGRVLRQVVPGRMRPGMTERRISHLVWQAMFEAGHSGLMRMGTWGEEVFLGHVSAGDSGNYPSSFNGPLGLRGEHPGAVGMGYAGKAWKPGEPLALDVGFCLEGYHSDKTQLYWAGAPGAVPDHVRRAQEFCENVQHWIAERLKPGAIPSELYAHCLAWAEREGWAEGFMGLPANKVKFIGHGIGLVIDGWPVIAKGFDEPLEAGMTLALEPKTGLPGIGMVGVENTFEVTEQGGRLLTGDCTMICVE